MIRNYIKVALRSLLKQKVYSFINITGLSVGIASCLLIVTYVFYEFSYDNFHEKKDRIHKVVLERKYPNHSTLYQIIPHSYTDAIMKDYAEVEKVTRMGGPFNNLVISYRNERDEVKQFEENFFMSGDSAFFDLFSIKLLKGDKATALSEPNNIVITEETANRYFGDADPMGKTLDAGFLQFKVTGVCENIPENSHMKFDFLASWDSFGFVRGINYITFSAHAYILLKPGVDPAQLESKFPAMVDTYASAQIERDLQKSWADYKREGNGYRYFLQPLTSIHLDPANFEAKMSPGGNIIYLYILISVAALILIIGCINFMNLATARSAERAREVGVRKTMGSMKGQLVSQFLTESILLSVTATGLAILLIQLALPYFNELGNTHLGFTFSPSVIAILLSIAVGVGLLAGSYPAFVLSAFNPVQVMKGKFVSSAKGNWLRNGLVVFQFWISIILIVGTLVISEQMTYMQNKSLGFDKDQVVVIERAFALANQEGDKTKTFLDEVRNMPDVVSASGANSLLGRQGDFFGAQYQPAGSSEILTTKSMIIDDNFAQAIGFEFADGHGFSEETNDSLNIILNEAAVKTLGIENPVGQTLSQIQRNPDGNVFVNYRIVGVIKNFNFQSLRDEITPLTIQSNESFGGGVGYAFIRIKGEKKTDVIASVEATWKKFVPDQPFKFLFMDDNLNAQYESEQRAGKIFQVFSGLAIIIACVGLFGLAAYTASLRTKEIGIRKVLGASVGSVVILLSRDFTKLILIAFVLAVPAGWYMMSQWLEGFAYRISMGIGTFLLAGVIAVLIAWITVSYQSIKAAIVNPVKSLRSE
jgi:putative ABC transport system permease protein